MQTKSESPTGRKLKKISLIFPNNQKIPSRRAKTI
jgi:hypothetical protein